MSEIWEVLFKEDYLSSCVQSGPEHKNTQGKERLDKDCHGHSAIKKWKPGWRRSLVRREERRTSKNHRQVSQGEAWQFSSRL